MSLGSNILPKEKNLYSAINLLSNNQFIDIIKESSLYKSEPLYYTKQNIFLNMVLKIKTSLSENELLSYCQSIEFKLGRMKNKYKNRPRIIDIDILTYGKKKYSNDILIIPHPKIHERKFVLVPWVEIDPDYFLINYKKNVSSLLNCTKDKSKVVKL